ncbi:hypothetical protein SAMN02746041_02237 [Desulfacinum hydrothermale DSM 13146]|uniref:DUF2333 family protein n=1 Tax=Desulfacinum hydrothermale DSM 13146 TaxID=1121390 RepID=A0A1W1XMW0_9BACT|nr:DUF2333 family protein [Desulfacinum hydrothermale]SMC25194.1 hypothetical protein SAMN02746041_02237 [Desulfacinum hydrothermale DSM 13146]
MTRQRKLPLTGPWAHLRRTALVAAGVAVFWGLFLAGPRWALALQKHTLTPSEQIQASAQSRKAHETPSQTAHSTDAEEQGAAPTQREHTAAPTSSGQSPEMHAGGTSAAHEAPGRESASHLPEPALPLPGHQEERPGVPLAHEPAGEVPHGEGEGVHLPEISPIPGVTFVETMINLMEHELHGRFLGWRPNDLILGRFTDNINNYQLGVLEAMRFTTLRLKDSLTRMGEADTYDRDLENALNLFMNKATLFWFPSAESSYGEAVEHLKKFLEKLKTGRRSFYYRVDNFMSLITSYGDLLGNVNKSLIIDRHGDGSPVSFFEVDDYFYYAKGVAHVMYEILKVARVGFEDQLVTIDAVDIMDEILHELHRAEEMDPWIVLDGDLDGFIANHRANINAPLSEAAHLMGIISRF